MQNKKTKWCGIHKIHYTHGRCPKCNEGRNKASNTQYEIDLLKARLAILEHSVEELLCQHMKL